MDKNKNGIDDSKERKIEIILSVLGSLSGIAGVGFGLYYKDSNILKYSVILILGSFALYQSTSITKYIKGML